MKVFKALILGDIHLGHPNNKTNYIINSLQLYFKENFKLIKECTHIILNGDVFEKALLSFSSEYIQSINWIQWLVKFCKEHNIKLRLLEGTPSHDNNQGMIIPTLIKEWNIEVDFRYIKDIDIEYDKDFDKYILFIPDRNDKVAKDRYKIVKGKMLELKIDKVDFAFIHGNFKYQLPIVSEHSHDEQDYLDIVRYYIVINHIHTPSSFERILAPGSFERLNHGEEEDKGGIYIEVGKDMKWLFLKNNHSRIFKTIRIDKDTSDIKKIFKEIDKTCKSLPIGSFIRLLVKEKIGISKDIKDKYNFADVKEEITNKTKANIRDLFNIKNANIVELEISKDNIIELLEKELESIDKKYLEIIKEKINKINTI